MKIQKAEIEDMASVAGLVRSLSGYYLEAENEKLPEWFVNSISDDSFLGRFTDVEYHNYVAAVNGSIVGYISVKNGFHLYHLFVNTNHHRKGIGKALWLHCVHALGIKDCTVRSSLYAVPVYLNLGFVASGQPISKDGIGYLPMVYSDASCEQVN